MTAQDDRALAALLEESGLDDDAVLADLVADLRGLAAGPAPEPVPAVAALLAPVPARRRPRRRGVVVGILVAATLGGGAAAAAATPAVRDGAASAVSSIVQPARRTPITRDQPVAAPVTTGTTAPADGASGVPVPPAAAARPVARATGATGSTPATAPTPSATATTPAAAEHQRHGGEKQNRSTGKGRGSVKPKSDVAATTRSSGGE